MFGEIEGVTEGQIFESRRELHDVMFIMDLGGVLASKELQLFFLVDM